MNIRKVLALAALAVLCLLLLLQFAPSLFYGG
jgi:hypothetical protein